MQHLAALTGYPDQILQLRAGHHRIRDQGKHLPVVAIAGDEPLLGVEQDEGFGDAFYGVAQPRLAVLQFGLRPLAFRDVLGNTVFPDNRALGVEDGTGYLVEVSGLSGRRHHAPLALDLLSAAEFDHGGAIGFTVVGMDDRKLPFGARGAGDVFFRRQPVSGCVFRRQAVNGGVFSGTMDALIGRHVPQISAQLGELRCL